MIDADDYIENDQKQDIPNATMHPFDLYPLELRLEMQEEIDFQYRCEKQQRAIEKVKQIAQARYEYNQDWLDSVDNGMRTLDDYINTFFISDAFFKQTKAKQEEMRSRLKFLDWRSGISHDRDFFKNIVNETNKNTPFMLETIYINLYAFDVREKNGGTNYTRSNQNNELQYSSIMLKTLYPFLTKEFHCFFSKIKNLPTFDKIPEALEHKQNQFNSLAVLNINKDTCKAFVVLLENIKKLIKVHAVFIEKQKMTSLVLWGIASEKMIEIILLEDIAMKSDLKLTEGQEALKSVNFFSTTFGIKMRSNFSLIYTLLREAQETNSFLNDFRSKEKSKKKYLAVSDPNIGVIEAVEVVPDLDEVYLIEDRQNVEVDDFIKGKQQQLFLWQERVKQRKVQKEEQLQMQQECINSRGLKDEDIDAMEMQNAQQLHVLYHNLDNADIILYNSLFKSDISCKPHNVRFRDIEKLIKNFGGTFERDTGSSHFTIHLPDTHHIWIEEGLNSILSYIDVPQATAGSYKPHNQSDEWSRSAHYLLQKAFIKAGITPERLYKAEQLYAARQGFLVQNGAIKSQEVRKVDRELNLK